MYNNRTVGRNKCKVLLVAAMMLASACGEVQIDPTISSFEVLEITKWPGGSEMAFSSLLYAPDAREYIEVNNWLIERGLFVDYTVLSTEYADDAERATYLTDQLLPAGFGYAGLGHNRLDGQELDYNAALAEFQANRAYLIEQGLNPVAFAYQDAGGATDPWQRALQDAGFLSGVRSGAGWLADGPCVLAGDVTAPANWWALASVHMQSEPCEGCAVDTEELLGLIEACREEEGWLITTYDSLWVDGTGDGAHAKSFYSLGAFKGHMEQVALWSEEGLIWLATINEATLFARQRRATAARLDRISENTYQLYLDDGLDRSIYTADMTLRLGFGSFFQDKDLIVQQGAQEIMRVGVDGPEMLVHLSPSAVPYLLLFTGR